MKEAILKALEQVNIDVVERRWSTYYLDVTDRFKEIIKDTSYEQLLKDFADLDGRYIAKFNANNFVDGNIYYIGLAPPRLSKLDMPHNNFRSSWDFLVKVKYISENKYELMEAKVIKRDAWP